MRNKPKSRVAKWIQGILSVLFIVGFFVLWYHYAITRILEGDQSTWRNDLGQPLSWPVSLFYLISVTIVIVAALILALWFKVINRPREKSPRNR
jgi:hypothetical protein